MAFIKAEKGLNHSVIYTDDSGKRFKYSGGSRAWRNNNPGNLRPGTISKRNNQIGVSDRFAIFPDYETGHIALIDLLKTKYINSSIDKTVEKFAPSKENNTENYKTFVHEQTGIFDDRKVKDFTDAEFEKFWQAIEQIEGYKIGIITEIYQITHVRKDKHGIIESYHVEPMGWVKKAECILLAEQGTLDVVVCRSRLGHTYLRSRPDNSLEDNLEHMDA